MLARPAGHKGIRGACLEEAFHIAQGKESAAGGKEGSRPFSGRSAPPPEPLRDRSAPLLEVLARARPSSATGPKTPWLDLAGREAARGSGMAEPPSAAQDQGVSIGGVQGSEDDGVLELSLAPEPPLRRWPERCRRFLPHRGDAARSAAGPSAPGASGPLQGQGVPAGRVQGSGDGRVLELLLMLEPSEAEGASISASNRRAANSRGASRAWGVV